MAGPRGGTALGNGASTPAENSRVSVRDLGGLVTAQYLHHLALSGVR